MYDGLFVNDQKPDAGFDSKPQAKAVIDIGGNI